MRVYDHYDGLQSKQFNYNAYYKTRSGEMVFGGINGFNTFYPEKIVENTTPANVVLTQLRIYNKQVGIGDSIDGDVVLDKSISVIDELRLGSKHKIFTLEFASLQYSSPEKYVFKTKLEGLEEDWQYRKAYNNRVTYTNLMPGEYTFKVSVANIDGYWNENAIQLKIIIVPPVWKTLWFRILSFVLVLSIVFGIIYYRLHNIKMQNIFLEHTVKKRTAETTEKNKMLHEANNLLKEKQEEIISQNEELEQHRNNLEDMVETRTKELAQALKNAKESDALKSSFLANMSHEIRTPMNAIVGFSNLLSEEEFSKDEMDRFVKIIQSNSSGLLKIIDEILDLSIIESNQLKIEKEVFDLNVLLDQIYSYYSLDNKNQNLEIIKNNPFEDQKIKLNNDIVRVKQVITNLMDNAFKFTQKGYIELGVKLQNDNLLIYVKDTGKGIAPDKIKNIFNQFIKIEDDDYEWTRGLGLGLSISQKIADVLGAKIIVESVENKGSVFTFSIPLDNVKTSNDVKIEHIDTIDKKNWFDKTILIAEDVEENYIYLESVLKKSNFKIIWAQNGEEAINAVKSTHVDLILMDIKMPILNGYEAAKAIKQLYPKKKIIAQTAYARPQEKVKFYDENFDEYLAKPINPVDLLKILEKFLS